MSERGGCTESEKIRWERYTGGIRRYGGRGGGGGGCGRQMRMYRGL